MEERLQKILSRAGFGSRRSCEVLISEGRVRVNGELAVLGRKADPERDQITLDGQKITIRVKKHLYIALNKPRGVLSDDVREGDRKTVFDLVPINEHLFTVGRLDYDSEGLILLTNDGDLANQLTHPRYGHEKEYRVLLYTRPDEKQLEAWRHGVVLEDGYRTAPANITIESVAGKGTWLKVIMQEGKKRQIREIGKTIGLPVQRIVRTRIGSLRLGNLKTGEWRHLTPEEIASLKKSTVKPKAASGKGRQRPRSR